MTGEKKTDNAYLDNQVASVPPWDSGKWFIFDNSPVSCSQNLAYQEALLCISQHLSDAADTVAPITWDGPAEVPANKLPEDFPPGPYTIPPQRSVDKFILRSMALYVLANLTTLDMAWPVYGNYRHAPCAELYAEALVNPGADAQEPNYLFGYPGSTSPGSHYFDDSEDLDIGNLDDYAKMVRTRMLFQAHILRAASRLNKKLIEKSLYANLSGTEQRVAGETDPLRGAKIAWGIPKNDEPPYNTLSHAIRVIAGRWEMGPNWSDPECGGVPAWDLLQGAYGPSASARYTDRASVNEGQRDAVQLLDASGIVLPQSTLDNAGPDTIREAVRSQLLINAAAKQGISNGTPEYDDFVKNGQGAVVSAMADKLRDADLKFALARSLGKYRMLTSSEEYVDTSVPAAGLHAVLDTSGVGALGGVSLEGGMPREDLSVDIISQAAGILGASQCSTSIAGEVRADRSLYTPFQDSFSLGQGLYRRLVVLREEAARADLDNAEGSAWTVANEAAAEVRAWAGDGRIVATGVGDDLAKRVINVQIGILGFDPSDFGVANVEDVGSQIALVYGPPWVADCATSARASCPDDFESLYMVPPTSVSTVAAWNTRWTGFDGTPLVLVFPGSGSAATYFQPRFQSNEVPTNHLYVILRHDPDRPSHGKVLGTVVLRHPSGVTGTVVSDKQREMLNGVLGISQDWATHNGQIGLESAASSLSYCIPNAPRGMFVPLESELTSDGDSYESSWRHYLTLAHNAAQRADALGEKLIELGFQKELRREAAGEELATICGSYGALDEIEIDKSKVEASDEDDGLGRCLDEDTIDVVFLTEDQAVGANAVDVWSEVLGCPSSNPLCQKDPDDISTAGLELTESVTPEPSNTKACEAAIGVLESLSVSYEPAPLDEILLADWGSATELESLLRNLQFEATSLDDWVLKSSGEVVMDSGDGKAKWPGCYRSGQIGGSCDDADLSVAVFDRIFRGSVGQGAFSGDDVAREQEAAKIGWRVQGALWLLASFAGIVPDGLFSVQLPAVNFTGQQDSVMAPLPTIYGFGKFEQVFGEDYYHLSQDVGTEREKLKDAWPITGAGYPGDFDAVPGWIRDIYGSQNYLHVTGKNPDVSLVALKNVPEFVSDIASGFKGLSCQSWSGDGSGGGGVPYKLLTDHKSRKGQWGQLCTTPKSTYKSTLFVTANENRTVEAGLRDRLEQDYDIPGVYAWRNAVDIIPLFKDASPDWNVLSPRGMELGTDAEFCTTAKTCKFVDGNHMEFLSESCIVDEAGSYHNVGCYPGGSGSNSNSMPFKYTHRMLRPTSCPAGNRVPAFVNAYPADGNCGAAAELSQAIALACELRMGDIFPPPMAPPQVTEPQHVPALRRWTTWQSIRASQAVSRLYLENVPSRVIEDIRNEKVGSGSKEGEHGRTVLQMGSSIRVIESGWGRISKDLASLALAVDALHTDLAAAKIYENKTLKNLAIQRLQIHQSMITAAASAIPTSWGEATWGPGVAAQALAAAAVVAIGQQQLGLVDDLEGIAGEENANMMTQAFINFQQTTQPLYADLEGALNDIQIAVADTLTQASLLRQNMAKAKYAAAKGAGEDFVMIDGKVVAFPVNTVLNRQYDITKNRYENALYEAQYLAFVARLAIEQRIGVRLNTMVEPVGPLEAPATWADDVCNLQGIDYERLRGWGDATPDADAGINDEVIDAYNKEIINEFADAYIGDYVTKLGNFVDYYNIDYPSHEGDDTAVLSLREDFLPGASSCLREAPNRLYFSDQLHKNGAMENDAGELVLRGWQASGCDDDLGRCLRVLEGTVLPRGIGPIGGPPYFVPAAANDSPLEDGEGGVTWLWEENVKGVAPGEQESEAVDEFPSRTVWQSVVLEPGSYMLSWRDQARSPEGYISLSQTGGQPSTLRVGVYNEQWTAVTVDMIEPHVWVNKTTDLWSPRRVLEMDIPAMGTYHVVFSISLGTEAPGSVAIANVQLEKTSSPGAQPSAYGSTGISRNHVSSTCENLSAAEMRAAFTHHCEAGSPCFYELSQPLIVDTSTLGTPESYLNGKLASGNFNFRHITIATNLVGTGVHDCEEGAGMSCYGSGFLEYTLHHDAFQSGVVGWNGEEQFFNFGSAAINHGKALAAERYITLPVSSNDGSLLAQPGIEKSEYSGRPLDGSYRLRIWDDGSLQWDRLEDVQVVLKYRYWSAIDAQP